jgi:hypothetical protein
VSTRQKPSSLSAFDPRFTRAQSEWALWRLVKPSSTRSKPTSVFRVRIKHLLEFDRAEPLDDLAHAFSDAPPQGRGEHSLFSGYDVLLLSLGLALLDVGFKRKEVVLLLRDLRKPLRSKFGELLDTHFSSLRAGLLLADATLLGSFRVALMLSRVERAADYAKDTPVIRPLVLEGMDNILNAVRQHLTGALILIDPTLNLYRLPWLLLNAPKARRGRG